MTVFLWLNIAQRASRQESDKVLTPIFSIKVTGFFYSFASGPEV